MHSESICLFSEDPSLEGRVDRYNPTGWLDIRGRGMLGKVLLSGSIELRGCKIIFKSNKKLRENGLISRNLI